MAPKTLFKVSGGFYNIRALQRTSNQGHRMLRKKERNENEARLNSTDFMDFRIFRAFLNFLQLFLRTKVSTQAPLKFFLWLQKHCSKHLGASTTPGLYNARQIKVIGCLGKKERNENGARLNSKDFMDFRISKPFLNFLQLFFRTKVST